MDDAEEPEHDMAWVLAEFVGGPLDGQRKALPHGVIGLGLFEGFFKETDPDVPREALRLEVELSAPDGAPVGGYAPEGRPHTMALEMPDDDEAEWDPTAVLETAGLPPTMFRWTRTP